MQLSLELDLDEVIEIASSAKSNGFATVEQYIMSLVSADNGNKTVYKTLSLGEIEDIINNEIFSLTPEDLPSNVDGYRLFELYNVVAETSNIPEWAELSKGTRILFGKLFNGEVAENPSSTFKINPNKTVSNAVLYRFTDA